MTIKEVETRTGLARSNVRFYEKEKLIDPARDASNGYRDYSEEDIENIQKIAFLRTMGLSIEDIRNIIVGKSVLYEILEKQYKDLQQEIADLSNANAMCKKLLDEENINYENMKVEQYVSELQDYWNDNQPLFKLDSVNFLYIWSSFIIWVGITFLCLFTGMLFYSKLPMEIPVQWSNGVATSFVSKKIIFVYPVACIVIRYLLRKCIYAKLQMNNNFGEIITEYLSNYLCFIVLSVEIFSILFIYGVVKSIVLVLCVDTFVLIGLLILGVIKMDLKGNGKL